MSNVLTVISIVFYKNDLAHKRSLQANHTVIFTRAFEERRDVV